MAIIKYSDYNKSNNLNTTKDLNIPKYSDYYSTSIPSNTVNSSSKAGDILKKAITVGKTIINPVGAVGKYLGKKSAEVVNDTKNEVKQAKAEGRNANIGDTLKYLGGNALSGLISVPEGISDTIAAGLKIAGKATSKLVDNKVGKFIFGEDAADYQNNPLYQRGQAMVEDEIAKGVAQMTEEKYGNTSYVSSDSMLTGVAQGVGQVGGLILTGNFMGMEGALPTDTSSSVFNTVAQSLNNPTSSTMFLSVTGNSYTEALKDGATEGEAIAYGLLNGAKETATEVMYGGLGSAFGKGALDDYAKNALTSHIKSKIGKKAAELGISMTAEGLEEVVATLLDPFVKYVYKHELSFDDYNNLMNDFVVGALTSGVLEGGQITVENILNNKQAKRAQETFNTVMNEENSTNTNVSEEITSNVPKNVSESISQDTQAQIDTSNAVLEELKSKREKATQKAQQERLDNQISDLVKQINSLNKNIMELENSSFSYDTETNNNTVIEKNSNSSINSSVETLKQQQLDIINNTNPMLDDYHTGIRNVEDIKTLEEAYIEAKTEAIESGYDSYAAYPDITNQMLEKGLETGKIKVYSSYPVENGVFVTPSYQQALDYSGNQPSKVYSKEVPINDVAWISVDEGQYAKVKNNIINTGNELPLPTMSKGNIPIQQDLFQKYPNNQEIIKGISNNYNGEVKIKSNISELENISLENMTPKELKQLANNIFDKYNNKDVFINDKNKIKVSKRGINESVEKILSSRNQRNLLKEHMEVFSDLGDIIEHATLVNQASNTKDRPGVNYWNYYYDGLNINGVVYNLEFDVRSMDSGENQYRVQKLEKKQIAHSGDASTDTRILPAFEQSESISNSTTTNQNSQISGVLPTNNMQQSNNNITKKSNNNTKDIMPLSRNSDMVIKASAKKIASQLNNSKQRSWVETSTESDVLKDKVLIKDLDVSKINYMPQSNQKSLNLANSKLERLGYENAINEVRNMMDSDKLPRAEDVALAERLLQEATRRGDSKLAQELVMDISIMGTDLGQATQALSIIQKLTPEGQLKMYETLVKRAKARGETSFENVQITPEMVEKILKVYKSDGTFEQADLNNAVEEFKQDIANQLKTTTGEKIDAWRYLAMLGNPKTHIRNVVSNVAMNGTIKVKNAMARTLETVLPIKDRTKTWKKSSDFVKDFSKTTANEMKSVITGEAKYNEKTSIESKKEIFKNKTLEKISNFNSNALEAEDWFFSKRAFQSTLEEYLTANNITTEADIKNNPEIVQKGINYSVEQAEIATFRQYSKLASSINQFERNHKALGYAIKATVPFKKTPINVAKAGAKYSPLGLIKNVSYDVYQLKQGNISASQFVDNLSQGLTGTSLTLLGYALAKAGFLKGAGDDDKEGKYDSQLGDSEYSIKIGGNSYSLSWLSPVAMPLFVGANAFEQLEEQKEWDINIVVDTLAKTFDPINEMSFLQSLTNVLTSYSSGTQKLAGMGESMVQSYAGQFFPTLFGQIASAFDDKKRSTKVSKNSPYRFGEQTVRSIMYKLPGLRNKLEVATDIWGNEKEQSSNIIERAFESFIAPYSKSKVITTDLDKELKKVYNETDETGVIPGIPYAYINYGNTYRMSASEYTQYKKTYGQTAYKLLNKTIQSKNYESLSYEEKAKVLKNVFGYSKYVANKEYFDSQNVDYTSKEYEKPYLYSKVGNISDYYLSKVKDFKADKDANGKTISGSAKNKAINYINSLKATIPEKAILIKMYGNFTFNDYNSQIVDYVKSKNISLEEKQKILEELGFTIKDGRVYW